MVMPRCFSSGALSISSNGVNATVGSCSCSTLVIAAVSVVLPWSMCPIVPMFKCGLVRSNLFFAIVASSPCSCRPCSARRSWPLSLLLAAHAGDDLLRDALGHLGVVAEVHGRSGPALRHRAQVGGVAEHLRERDVGPDHLCVAARLELLDAAAAAREVAHHVAGELLGGHHLDAH